MCLRWVSLLLVVLHLLQDAQCQRLEVHPSSPHCAQQGQMLNCDFKNSPETAFLEDVYRVVSNPKFPGLKDIDHSGRSAQGISVRNIRSLVIPWAACVDLELTNVKSVMFGVAGDENDACSSASTSIKLVESHANIIPRYISRLDVTKSSIETLHLDNDITQLEAVDSNFEELNIVSAISQSQIVKFERCNIKKLKKLSVTNRATLQMIDTNIEQSKPKSISIENTAATIHNCKFTEPRTVTIGANAEVSFKGTDSYLELTGPMDESAEEDANSERFAPGVPIPGAILTCHQQSSLIWIIPIVAVVVETIIIIFIKFKTWIPGLGDRSGGATSPVSSGFASPSMFPGVVGGVPRGMGTGNQYQSDPSQSSNNWYYSSESSTPISNLKYRGNF
ncbi:unnamed protein product [Meganyctiphanes norvegica]|uniref:Uncharacterized protein n=1 Tax=Meganyctiphanes norvegica TaxID=48144 RepID=A0AAV2SIX6_MEGNR